MSDGILIAILFVIVGGICVLYPEQILKLKTYSLTVTKRTQRLFGIIFVLLGLILLGSLL